MREIIQNTPQNQERGQKTVCFVKKKEQIGITTCSLSNAYQI